MSATVIEFTPKLAATPAVIAVERKALIEALAKAYFLELESQNEFLKQRKRREAIKRRLLLMQA